MALAAPTPCSWHRGAAAARRPSLCDTMVLKRLRGLRDSNKDKTRGEKKGPGTPAQPMTFGSVPTRACRRTANATVLSACDIPPHAAPHRAAPRDTRARLLPRSCTLPQPTRHPARHLKHLILSATRQAPLMRGVCCARRSNRTEQGGAGGLRTQLALGRGHQARSVSWLGLVCLHRQRLQPNDQLGSPPGTGALQQYTATVFTKGGIRS